MAGGLPEALDDQPFLDCYFLPFFLFYFSSFSYIITLLLFLPFLFYFFLPFLFSLFFLCFLVRNFMLQEPELYGSEVVRPMSFEVCQPNTGLDGSSQEGEVFAELLFYGSDIVRPVSLWFARQSLS